MTAYATNGRKDTIEFVSFYVEHNVIIDMVFI